MSLNILTIPLTLVIFITIIYQSFFITAFPFDSKALSLPRQAPLLPWGSGSDDHTGAKGYWDPSWYLATCQIGLYDLSGFQGAWWEGQPIGSDPNEPTDPLNNFCVNVKDLHESLAGTISSFRLTGWCQCDFFAEEGCTPESGRFRAYNREDSDMAEHGHDDNAIRSFKCWFSQRADAFQQCNLKLYQLDPPGNYIGATNKQPTDYIIQEGDLEICWILQLPDGFVGTDVTMNGCTCDFFTEAGCSGTPAGTWGNWGFSASFGPKKRSQYPSVRDGIKALQCYYPHGIVYTPRNDGFPQETDG
ncbi:hypothetical protein TWF694_006704 [Orbilia ellipsospora]|uniref:Uncharacterized protein n=1 Tax=Orbilia ellipsospora TaxID=2528407 RepID=A0AAV9XSN2_9PEZI